MDAGLNTESLNTESLDTGSPGTAAETRDEAATDAEAEEAPPTVTVPVVDGQRGTAAERNDETLGSQEPSDEGDRGGTRPLDEGSTDPPATSVEARRAGAGALVADLARTLPRALRRDGWIDLFVAAFFAFLVLVACGAVLVAAAKLQYQFLGDTASALDVLTSIVMVGIAVLRVPLEIGDLSVSAMPLGALAVVGYSLVWATARVVRRGGASTPRAAAGEGAQVAIPFALLCWIAALVFRFRTGETPAGADALSAFLLALIWGALFGVIGGLRALKPLRQQVGDAGRVVRGNSRAVYEGLSAAGVMLFATFLTTLFAALIWIIVGLLEGRPHGDFGIGDAAAALIYLLAFGPNVVVAIATVAHGAPVEVGAQVTSSGRSIGSLNELSLFDWGASGPPWFAFLLLLIPISAGLLGGFYARRNAADTGSIVQVLGVAATTYALVLFEFAALAEARLGAGLIRARGFGRVAPDAGTLLLLAFAWAIVAGLIGWKIGDAQSSPEEETA